MTAHPTKSKRWRPRFSVRTLVVVVTLVCICLGLAPWINRHYRKWRSASLWATLEEARTERELSQQLWNEAYTRWRSTGELHDRAQEQVARQPYFKARDKVELARDRLLELYGTTGTVNQRIVFRDGEKCLIPYE